MLRTSVDQMFAKWGWRSNPNWPCLSFLFFLLLLFVLVCSWSRTGADAATVPFIYESTCIGNCGVIGLADGAPVSGKMFFSESTIAPSAILLENAVEKFSLKLGSVAFTQPLLTNQPGNPPFLFFAGRLDPSAQFFDEFDMHIGQTVLPAQGAIAFLSGPIASDRGSVFLKGGCDSAAGCGNASGFAPSATLASGRLSVVPIPAALPLFATAVAGLGIVAWLRRKVV